MVLAPRPFFNNQTYLVQVHLLGKHISIISQDCFIMYTLCR